MVVNMCEAYLGVVCVDTRKDIMWQVTNKKYSEQCIFWIVYEQHRLKYVLISPSQKNTEWQSNKLTHLLACHLQRDDGTYGQLNYFQQRICYQSRKTWSSFDSAGSNYHSLLTKTAWDFILGSGWSYSNRATVQAQVGTLHVTALRRSRWKSGGWL